jgi:dihydrofolate synthase/folylpolyglutamate synthase
MPETPYARAVDYLQRRLWHELPIMPIERALQARVRVLLEHFGDPHRAFPVVQVGGSAGKGSTATITAAILRAAGLRTACYTSPHLQTFIERAAIDGTLIPPDTFAEHVLGLEPLVRQMHIDVLDGNGAGRPALVEAAFACCMKWFADKACDAGVIEVGLGGRTDCTNVFDDAPVRVITNVDYEHVERLGPTITDIAREKSGIIHGGETVITAARRPDALREIARRCDEHNATLWRLGSDVRLRIHDATRNGSTISVRTPLGEVRSACLPLAGDHQAANAALAVAATQAFCAAQQIELPPSAIIEGLATVRISGRLETVQRDPTVLLDSAHNPAGARQLARALRDHWLPGRAKLHLVLGVLADKDQRAIVRALAPVAATVVVTQPPLGERTGDPTSMLALLERALGPRNISYEPSPTRALDEALARARRTDVVCVTGSMFLVGALRNRWLPEAELLRHRSSALIAQSPD